jgi:hypothetical protein
MHLFKILFILSSINIINSSFLIDLLQIINKMHDNYFTIGGATNLFACFPLDSDKCTRVSTFSIAKNNTFECQEMHIGINLFDVIDYTESKSTPLFNNCTGKRVTIFGYLSEKNGTLTFKQATSSSCPRVKR